MNKREKRSSVVLTVVFLLVFFTAFSTVIISVEAVRKNRHVKRTRAHKLKKEKEIVPAPAPAPAPAATFPPRSGHRPPRSAVFNILSFGAKGDGVSDDSKAVEAAWEAACKVSGATVEIPSQFTFLIYPITLQGPCMPGLVFQVEGNVLAPRNVGSWPKSSIYQWLNFKWVHSFTIQGSGTFDGQGFNWWKSFPQLHINNQQEEKASKTVIDMKPTVLRFYASYNVTIHDITIINSPQCHLKFDNSKGVKVQNITISTPENSPNTDGIHLQNTQDVEIHHSTIASGDDCVSIQTGCSNIHVHHINCGPGHGISLGGLGKDKTVACVSNILVSNIILSNTLYGARIKTWQGGAGSVKNVTFSDIQVSEVGTPMMIDQYYCDKHVCENHTAAVAILDVNFRNIVGSFVAQPFHLACSGSVPCTEVELRDIRLEPSRARRGFLEGACWNSYGKAQGELLPASIDYCVRSGGLLVRRIARSHERVCGS